MSTTTAKDFVSKYVDANEDERMDLVEEARKVLSGSQMKKFKTEIKRIEEEEKEEAEEAVEEEDSASEAIDTPGPSTIPSTKELKKEKAKKVLEVVVSDAEMEMFWSELEKMSGEEMLDEQVVKDFQYVGFNPNVILKSIIAAGHKAKKDKNGIIGDIAQMCTIAIIKGSITDTNLKKMSDEGKRSYQSLELTYGLKRNGSKGVDPNVITIARVGAAFPGSMSKILSKRPDLAKKFAGPFMTKNLPPYLRHQSAAACVPETMDQKVKDFILGLVTAFTSDQSKVISKTKDKPEEVYAVQENFITQTHSSSYPAEDVRKSIARGWTLLADFDKLKAVGDNISKIHKDFVSITREELASAVGKL